MNAEQTRQFEILGSDMAWRDGDRAIGPDGDYLTSTGTDCLKQWLYFMLGWAPGAVMHRPEFGAGCVELRDEPIDQAMRQTITNRIRAACAKNPNIESIESVWTQQGTGSGIYNLIVGVRVIAAGQPAEVERVI